MKEPAARFAGRAASALIAAAVALAAAAIARAEVPTGVFTYAIHNDQFGDVGVYTNVVRRDGGSIIVENHTEITIKWMFLTVFRLSATSTAVWRGGRIVRYDGFTDDDGRKFAVSARADGERFVIEGTAGRFVGPAEVFPHNPWNKAILGAGAIMSPKSGKLFAAKVSGGQNEDVEIAGKIAETVTYRIDTDRRTWVWYGDDDVPVKFVMERKRGRELLTFTLQNTD